MPTKILSGLCIFALSYVWWSGKIIHDQPDRTTLIASIWHHVGVGLLLLIPLLVLIFLSWKPKYESQSIPKDWSSTILRWIPIIFWLNVFLLGLTGPLTVWARGSALKLFDWFAIPSPVERLQRPYELLEKTHGVLGSVFLGLLVLYLLNLAIKARRILTIK